MEARDPHRLADPGTIASAPAFDAPDLFEQLEAADDDVLDTWPFGVIAMTLNGRVTSYNAAESRLSGLSPHNVIGRYFFRQVAPCANNFMIAHRYENEASLDAYCDYVFSFVMEPTPVRLRMLKRRDRPRMFLVVAKRSP